MPPIPLDEQIAEINRELHLRIKVYPDFIRRGTLTRAEANRKYGRLMAARDTLLEFQRLRDGAQTSLPLSSES